jgi:hypothetical protein
MGDQVPSKQLVCAVCAEPWRLGHICRPTPVPSKEQNIQPVTEFLTGLRHCTATAERVILERADFFRLLSLADLGAAQPPVPEQSFDPMPFVGMPADDSPLSHQEIFSAVLHHASEIVRLTQCVPAECLGTLPEYESVGYQYKFHGAFGGVTWRDSSNDYNGGRYVESREIFAKRPTATKGA